MFFRPIGSSLHSEKKTKNKQLKIFDHKLTMRSLRRCTAPSSMGAKETN